VAHQLPYISATYACYPSYRQLPSLPSSVPLAPPSTRPLPRLPSFRPYSSSRIFFVPDHRSEPSIGLLTIIQRACEGRQKSGKSRLGSHSPFPRLVLAVAMINNSLQGGGVGERERGGLVARRAATLAPRDGQ
jgi:hypothetical protein